MPQTVTKFHPIYDPKVSWMDQVISGPKIPESIPKRVWKNREEWKELFGLPLASPIGVPAGPLFTSSWVQLASRLGFDLITYKTVRSHQELGHPLPNVCFIEVPDAFSEQDIGKEVIIREALPDSPGQLAITNSFGNPSMGPDFLQTDIAKSKSCLEAGQILIVSVFGVGSTLDEVAEDFAKAAALANDAGADVIEANFSCPNVAKAGGGALFESPDAMTHILRKMIQVIGSTPLIVKTGFYSDPNLHREAFQTIAKASAQGVCGLNTLSMKVLNSEGMPALGPERPTSGTCGAPIRKLALQYIRESRVLIERDNLPLTLLGCGGIVEPDHFNHFLEYADGALTATGMMWKPFLALKWHEQEAALCKKNN